MLVAGVMRSGYSPFVRAAAFYRCAAPPHANDAPDSPKNIPASSQPPFPVSSCHMEEVCIYFRSKANQLPGILSTFRIVIHLSAIFA